MKVLSVFLALIWIVGCVSKDRDLKETLHNNPRIVFDLIEENPEMFLTVVNKAARQVRQKQYEKQMAQMQQEQSDDLKNPKQPKLSANRLLLGKMNSPITLVEYGDFQCPACRLAYENLKTFKAKYKGKIRYMFKNMPLDMHPMSHPAARYFEALRRQSSKLALKFHNTVFEHQQSLRDKEYLPKLAKSLGANMKKLKADLNSDPVKTVINGDIEEFESYGFTGTPVIILNGVAMRGAQSEDQLERILKLTKK